MEQWMMCLDNMQLLSQVSPVSWTTPSKGLLFWLPRIKERITKNDGCNPTGQGGSSGPMVHLQECLRPHQPGPLHPYLQSLLWSYLTSPQTLLLTINQTSSVL